MKSQRFSHSFHPRVKPPKGEPCATKEHYTGVLRELVGFLDAMAERDASGERFVYTSVKYILKHEKCKRFKGEGYSERAVWDALAKLRKDRILSKPVIRERWVPTGQKGRMVLRKFKGSIMAPHVSLSVREGDVCHMRGWLTNGRWDAAKPGDPNSIHWVPSAEPIAERIAEQVQGELQSECSADCRASAVPIAVPIAVTNSAHIDEVREVNPENRSQAVKAVETFLPVQTVRAEPSRNKTAGQGLGAVSPSVNVCKPRTQWKQKLKEFQEGEFEDDEVPPALAFSQPFDSDLPTLMALIEEHGDDFFAKSAKWARYRQPPLDGPCGIQLKNRWVLCLEECFGITVTRG